MKKIRVGIFFGGRSSEHEISIKSAKSIIKSLDGTKYDIVLVGVDKCGCFHFGKEAIACNMPLAARMFDDLCQCNVIVEEISADLPQKIDDRISKVVDVVFPVFHGTFGEDGTVQGLLRMFDVPFVGAGVLGSAIGMDKDVTKRLLRDSGIKVAKHMTFSWYESDKIFYENITAALGEIIFVKPVSLGSSVGVSKVESKSDFNKAIEEVFLYDNKVIIEEFINGREIECSVFGNEHPEASLPGEIIVNSDFYSYSAKYLDKDAAYLQIPADLPTQVVKNIREIAVNAYKVLCCDGMARIDFFITGDFQIFLNEINTIPGFTEEISMYPKLWAASDLPYSELLDKLIELAISRHDREKNLITNFETVF
ncbi:MAG: D-alanine--D-alanine ligase [Holosporaceae bacterium]|jgi:D-alanine-D-alanine ligase|nr:D-alanine--D-alanine ligase [Holosporaceae bacterium]